MHRVGVCVATCGGVRGVRARLRRRIYARAPTTGGTHAPRDLSTTRPPIAWPCGSSPRTFGLGMCQWLNASDSAIDKYYSDLHTVIGDMCWRVYREVFLSNRSLYRNLNVSLCFYHNVNSELFHFSYLQSFIILISSCRFSVKRI